MTLSSITHTARCDHLCAFCGRTVATGERYVRAQVPGGGRVAKQAFHQPCYEAILASVNRKNETRGK